MCRARDGDGDKTDKNVSNDIDGDGLPTWVPPDKTFNYRPAGEDVQDDDPTTPLPWDPDGDQDPNDNDAYGRLERDAQDFMRVRLPKGP